jgi:uncharacterized protein (TIGR02646 family)
MIKIQRTNPGSARLLKSGTRQTERDCAAYDASPKEYISGAKRFPQKNYYNWKVVKDALMKMHHGKCCYCEKQIERADLHVEHFRPRGALRQAADADNEYPGYYWLAYSWDNLLLACPTCNVTKRSTFPLENPEQRARSHNDDLASEKATFVNPAVDDPRDHIRFKDDAPYPLTECGRRTINELELHRDELFELRLKYFKIYKYFRFMLKYSFEHNQTRFQQKTARGCRQSGSVMIS